MRQLYANSYGEISRWFIKSETKAHYSVYSTLSLVRLKIIFIYMCVRLNCVKLLIFNFKNGNFIWFNICVCIFVNTWILQNISGNTHKKPVTGNKAAGSISSILFYLSNSSPKHVFTVQKLILTCKKKK